MTTYDTLMQALDEWNKAPWRRDDDDNPYTAEITLSRALRAHRDQPNPCAELEQQVSALTYNLNDLYKPRCKELEADCDTFYNSYNDAVGKLVELEAERDRLREALRGLLEIAEIHCQLLPDTPAPLDGPIGVARKALEET